VKIPPGGAYIAFFWSKVPLGAPLYKYGWKTLGYIAVDGEIPLEGHVFFACSRPIAPKGSLVCPQNDHSNHSPNPPSSVRASYLICAGLWSTPRAVGLGSAPLIARLIAVGAEVRAV